MDTLTHAVIGALVIRTPKPGFFAKSGLNETQRVIVVAAASAFPDIDYAGFGVNPYQFITQWHRGITHSLLLLPLWAVILGFVFTLLLGLKNKRKEICLLTGLGLLVHVIGDLITVYGTQIVSPISDYRIGLGYTFDVDIWIAVIAAISLALSFYRRSFARYGLICLGLYLSLTILLQAIAIHIAEDQSPSASVKSVYALPQPFSPAHRSLVVESDSGYWQAHLSPSNIANWLKVLNPAKPGDRDKQTSNEKLRWNWYSKPDNPEKTQSISGKVWRHEKMEPFRRFVQMPAVYRIDQDENSLCIWFTDLRYVIKGIVTPFRYGMCRVKPGLDWKMYRLKRFTEFDRELIP